MNLYKLEFKTSFLSDELYLFLEENIKWGWEEVEKSNCVIVRAYFSYLKDAELVKEKLLSYFSISSKIEGISPSDWSKNWKTHFRPVNVAGELLVIPPWEYNKFKRQKLKKILIYPQMAFGTGHHPTTYLCLESICYLAKTNKISKGSLFLDIGTGSGILSFACISFGLRGIGIDIDKKALENAKLNKKLNRIKDGLVFVQSDIFSLKSKFKLILANIQANFHISYAKDLLNLLDKKGWLVLSGIVLEQKDKVVEVYKNLGLKGPITLLKEGWVNLLWERDG